MLHARCGAIGRPEAVTRTATSVHRSPRDPLLEAGKPSGGRRTEIRVGLIAYSLVTNYELGVWKVAPMAVHNLIDIVAGGLLATSPWLFRFVHETAKPSVPQLAVGLAAVFLGLTTKQQGGYSYRRAEVVG